MKRLFYLVSLLTLLSIGMLADVVEQIVVKGNRKVSADTVLFYMKSKPKGLYSPEMLRADFVSLWETGFFSDIKIESEPLEGGQRVLVTVEENPLITKVIYKTGSKVKEKDITEKLTEQNVSLAPFTYYSSVKKKKIEAIIKAMLQEKGFNGGSVEIKVTTVKDQVELLVDVVQGSKTKIGAIVFPGLDKKRVSAGFLHGGMKNNKVHGLISTIMSKDVYNQDKINEDLEEVKLRLKSRGYLEAKVGQPVFGWVNKKLVFGGLRKMMKISIPVEMGPRYTVGEIKIEGNTIVRSDYIKTLVELKKGQAFNLKKRNKSVEEIQKIYSSLGYFYCRVVPEENLDPVKKIADLTLKVMENELVYVGKINFTGNTFTKDQVIRREWLLQEGSRLRLPALEDSLRRMKQLGLVSVEKNPQFKQNPDNVQIIDMDVEVQELNRQMINFSTGYSGYDGFFIALGYSTKNFMGMGESLSANVQYGSLSQNYRLSFSEPYILNLNASGGIDVFKTSLNYYDQYTREGTGFNLSTSWRFWRFWGGSMVYSFEKVTMGNVSTNIDMSNPLYAGYYMDRNISALSPTIYYSTVDSPIFPTNGSKLLINYRYSGGILGGNLDMHKIKAEVVQFIPLWKHKHTLGLHLQYEGLFGFNDTLIPNYERFYLGGERSIRGFDVYRLGPKNTAGTCYGGTKSILANVEYQIPLNQQFSFVFFYDIGNAYDDNRKIDLSDIYQSMGLELKLFIPMLNVPFRLIFSYNPRLEREGENHYVFRLGIGPSFY